MSWDPEPKEHPMTIMDELLSRVDCLDDEGHDYQNVRAIKRIVHNLAKTAENLEKSK